MNKKRGLFGLLTAFISSLLTVTAFGYWNFNSSSSELVTKADDNTELTMNQYSNDKAVAYIDNAPSVYYTSIEKALNAATSGRTVYVIAGTNPQITRDCTIRSGVTLTLPYDGTTWNCGTSDSTLSDSFIDTSTTNINKYRVNQVKLVNSTLTVALGGTLNIGGKFRAKGICGYYSEIALDSNSHINVYGTLNNYGYIKEIDGLNPNQSAYADVANKYNNEIDSHRYVEVFSGGLFKGALAVYSGLSASYLMGLNNAGICPVETFDFPNTQTYLKVNAGGTLQAQAKIYVSASTGNSKAVDETVTIITNQSTASSKSYKPLFFLESGFMSIEYCANNVITADAKSKTIITVNGSLNMGYLYINLSVATIDTSSMFLPIGYKFGIIVNSGAVFTSSYKLKFLEGSFLRLEKGSTANLNSDAIFYKTGTMNDFSSSYPTDCEDAKFTNNGTLVLGSSSHLGGHVYTESGDGTATINTTGVAKTNLTATSTEGTTQSQITLKATGSFYISSDGDIQTKPLDAGQTIVSCTDGKQCWANGYLNSCSLTIKVINPNGYTYPAAGFQVYKYNSSGSSESLQSSQGKYETDIKTYEYFFEPNEQFKVNSLARNASVLFTQQTGTSYTFTSGTKYSIKGDVEITITAGEGYEIWFMSSGQSGNGGSTKVIYENGSSSGTFATLLEGGSGGANEKIIIGKNQYVKYKYTKGTGTASFKGYYKFNGHVSDTTSTTNGTSVGTSGTSNAVLIDKEYTLLAYMEAGSICFSGDTLITMANGTQRRVETLHAGDVVMTFNHNTGVFEPSRIGMFIRHNEEQNNNFDLRFSNGSHLNIITLHGIYNATLKRYVEIGPKTYQDYIGDEFVIYNNGSISTTRLVGCEMSTRVSYSWSIVTWNNMNAVTNGILSSNTAGYPGFYNFFEMNEEFKYDQDLMKLDIQTYGLYTYDEWSDYMSEAMFELTNMKYLKIKVGKGITTKEEIISLFELFEQIAKYEYMEIDSNT